MNVITELLIITALFIITTILFGFLFAFINKQNSKFIQRNFGWGGFCFFGCIGVPVHEASHFVMAVLFHHKVTAVSLFRPKKGRIDGVLGYVRHSYRNTMFQKMGNFFIGAAPMITGAFLIRQLIFIETGRAKLPELSVTSWQSYLFYIRETVGQARSMFCAEQMRTYTFWIVLLCIIGIAVNMNMSSADVKNSMHGIVSLFVVTAVIPFVLHLGFRVAYTTMAVIYMGVLIQYISILFYALVICCLILLLMYLLSYLL